MASAAASVIASMPLSSLLGPSLALGWIAQRSRPKSGRPAAGHSKHPFLRKLRRATLAAWGVATQGRDPSATLVETPPSRLVDR
jgi:hypothetical protein